MNSTLNNDFITTPPRDAATVVLLRDASPAMEVLLLCRGASTTVMNNAWVFPGGKLDQDDFNHRDTVTSTLSTAPEIMLAEQALDTAHASALFIAACRETEEETGVTITPDQLIPWSRWITPNAPAMMKKRFDARFFLARMPTDQTAIHDGQEATDSAWFTARDALESYRDNKITLAPPQIMTLAALARHPDTDATLTWAKAHPPYCIEPAVFNDSNGNRTLAYPGDPQHPDKQRQMPGPTKLIWKQNHFEPENGFEAFFTD